MTLGSSRASATDSQLSKHLTVFAYLCRHLQPQSSSLRQHEWDQIENGQLLAGCCLESELLEGLLKQNIIVSVTYDLEALEALFRRNEVCYFIEQLVDCLGAAGKQANFGFVFDDFNMGNPFVVCGFARLVPEFLDRKSVV